ncbi:hypothetical protein LRS06_07765 [Hymenobacter sp. J193]|uniref:PQQ-binding-like beta-propeller repeat protein n=1 Tax=Hymenobacter sp. J193 TaxID=2898429 RepID=UPI0021518067|nr:PQQ-binding-like beta-propeller repeat protein [Hymenobacter sp. J193]MCR5887676.1 hypothetical protein [Hymenobacter sp. J193]
MKFQLIACLLLCLGLGVLPGRAQTPAGNVGIGTTTPTQKLDVDGNLRIRGLSGTGIRLPQVQPDGTISIGTPLFSSAPGGTVQPQDAIRIAPDGEERTYDVVLYNNRLYAATDNGLRIYDVSTPTAPVLLGQQASGANALAVSTNAGRTLLYSADYGNLLQVFDVTNPAAVSLLSQQATGSSPPTSSYPIDIAVSGTTVYVVNADGNTLEIFDVSNPLVAPVRRSTTLLAPYTNNLNGIRIVVAGTTAYIIDAENATLYVYNVSSPGALVRLNGAGGTVLSSSPYGLALSGSRLYIATNDGKLHVYDVTTPATPALLGSATGGSSPIDLAVVGTKAVLLNYDATNVQVFDVSNPASPRLESTGPALPAAAAATAPSYAYPYSLATDGNTAYIGVDFSSLIGVVTLGGTPRVVAVGPDGSLGSVPAPAAPTLSLSGQTLSISGGNSVTLPSTATPGDNMGNHTATENLKLNDKWLSNDGGSEGLRVDNAGNVGIGSAPITSRLRVLNSGSYDVATFESGNAGPHLQLTKTGAGAATIDYIGTDFGDSNRRGALELRGVKSVTVSGDGNPDAPDLVVTEAGNVGIGTGSAAATSLDVNGALTLRPNATVINLTIDNQAVPVGNRSFLQVASNSAMGTDRTVVLGAGSQAGQVLYLMNMTNSCELIDFEGVVNLSQTRLLTAGDVLQLIWSGTKWFEVSYSNN